MKELKVSQIRPGMRVYLKFIDHASHGEWESADDVPDDMGLWRADAIGKVYEVRADYVSVGCWWFMPDNKPSKVYSIAKKLITEAFELE